ncbi:MAG: hypothetical protein RLZZ238_2727 [Planctomycetota bacterium]
MRRCNGPSILPSAFAIAAIPPAILLAACERGPAPKAPAPPVPVAAAPAAKEDLPADGPAAVDPSQWRTSTSADDPTIVEVAGLRGPKPASWVWTKPSMQFRTLQYAVAGEEDSTKAAELIISVFPAGDGGPIDANITRWRGQFRMGDSAPEAIVRDFEVGPLQVKLVELEGDYMAMGAPAARRGFAQLGAIVQAQGRNVFFRLLGPKETVEANRGEFMNLIEGLMPAD